MRQPVNFGECQYLVDVDEDGVVCTNVDPECYYFLDDYVPDWWADPLAADIEALACDLDPERTYLQLFTEHMQRKERAGLVILAEFLPVPEV